MSTTPSESGVTTCYRHRDHRAGVVCQRCDRPICAQCMHQASVGFHCPECVKGGTQRIYRGAPPFDPIATKAIIGLNLLAFLWSSADAGSIRGIGARVLFDYGLFGGDGTPIGVANGEAYRLVTSGFLHDGFVHVGFNMMLLWLLGSQLERLLDRPRYVALFAVSLLGGSAGAIVLQPDKFAVGASGAVFGLFGAIAVIQTAAGRSIWDNGIGQVLAINLLLTFVIPQVSIGGHLGGLVAGAAVGGVYVATARAGQNQWVGTGVAVALGAALVAVSIVVAANPLV